MGSRVVIRGTAGTEVVASTLNRLHPITHFPFLTWLFPDGPEVAFEEARTLGRVRFEFYARDDDFTTFHGRGRDVFYTFAFERWKQHTEDSLRALASGVPVDRQES